MITPCYYISTDIISVNLCRHKGIIFVGAVESSNITVGMFLERHSQQYYIRNVPPVLGYGQDPPLLNTLNSTTLTYDYSEEVVWRADRVEVDSTEFNEQGFTKYNADHGLL